MRKFIIAAFLAAFSISFAFAEELSVTVSIAPQKYIAEKIGGDRARINVFVSPGADPHTFSPKAGQVAAISDSKLYLGIGFPFEGALLPQLTSSFKNLTIVDTSAGVSAHDDDDHYDHHHEGHDPHLWTNPESVLIVARNTYEAFITADPAGKDYYATNYAALVDIIQSWEDKFADLFEKPGVPKDFLIYHPFLGHFAEEYGLTQHAVEQNGKSPKAKALKKIIENARDKNIKVFFKSPQDATDAPQSIAIELGIPITVITILTDDWEGMMDTIYTAFESAAE